MVYFSPSESNGNILFPYTIAFSTPTSGHKGPEFVRTIPYRLGTETLATRNLEGIGKDERPILTERIYVSRRCL